MKGASAMRQSASPPVWDANRLRIATAAAGVALWSWHVDTDEIALDERARALWGVPLNSDLVTFEQLSARIHPEDLDRVRAAFTATREIFGDYELDFRIEHRGEIRWISSRGRGDEQGIIGRIMFGIFLDVSERKLAEEARELLANEMSHRVKNLFAIASALTEISARSAKTTTDMAHDISRRLKALSHAHDLVRPTLSEQKKATQLNDLLAVLLNAYDDDGAVGERIRVSVPDVLVGEGSITTLALIVHELATNALKYGALARPTGTIDVSCTVEGEEVVVLWREKGGGQMDTARGRPGFGSTLINRSITSYLSGSIDVDWRVEGAVITLRMSKARLGV